MIRDRDLDRRRWLRPESDDELDEATWERIEERLDAAPKRSVVWPVGVGVVLAAAAALWLVARPAAGVNEWSEGELVAGGETLEATMDDGSIVEAEPHSILVRESNEGEDVHVRIAEGAATFEVVRDEGRNFVVHADDVEVVVVGTRFQVTRGETILVAVERGAVEIRQGETTTYVSAGETWEEPDETPVAPVEVADVEPVEADDDEDSHVEAEPRVSRPSPARLFEAAQEARREGRHQEAARRYGEFIRRHPRHNNAPLAAFELGRLKMDVLGDPQGAARAFGRASRRGSPFRQDAMARRVQALGAAGDGAGCETARARYEAAFPSGRHLRSLAGACE